LKADPVRSFPRTARRRLAAATAAGALAIGALTAPLANADDLKDRQKNVQKQIRHANHDLEESSSRARQATARLQAAQVELNRAKSALQQVRTRLTAARIRDHEMKVRLAAAEERLANAEADLVEGRAALETQRGAVTDVITSIYEEGDPQLLAFSSLLDATTPADLSRRMEMQNAIVGGETRAYDELRAAEVLLEVREQQVQEAKDEVAVQRREAAEHLETMKALTVEARNARARVQDRVQERRGARQQAVRARQHDLRQLQQLRTQERRIKQLIMEQARKAKGGYNGATGGFLDRPVPGIVTSPFGYRVHPIYGYYGLHNGTDFRVGCGEPLHASAGGKVISRYYSSVYGNRLYLGVGMVNGKYLTVVYNHLSGYRVGVGQTVGRGEVIGYGGTTGWSTACHLHYTVLANGQPVNPMNYM
jgi:murein DD-endopeptidase MepM/ murein hydrolase activator NlpD